VFTRSPDQPLSDYLTSIARITGAVKHMMSGELAAPCESPNAVLIVKSESLLRGSGHVIKMCHERSAYKI
jgi:hemin uptake protein HemP